MTDQEAKIRAAAQSIAITCHLLGGTAEIAAASPRHSGHLLDSALSAIAQLAEDATRLIAAGFLAGLAKPQDPAPTPPPAAAPP